jgi:hypothetical protein
MMRRRIIPVVIASISMGACAQLSHYNSELMDRSTYQESQVGSGSGWAVTGGIDTPTIAQSNRLNSERMDGPRSSSGGAATGGGDSAGW